jgi:hypothetical protein
MDGSMKISKRHIIPLLIALVLCIGAYSGPYVRQEGIFAEIHVHDNSTAQSIPAGAGYTLLTHFDTNGAAANMTPDQANNKITITIPGIYKVSGAMSFASGTANVTFFASAFAGGVEQDNVHWTRKAATSTDVGSAGLVGLVTVSSVPTDLDVRVRHNNVGAIDFTGSYMTLVVEYKGDV